MTLDSVIDKLRAAERRWEESEGRLRAILDSATDYAIFTTDEDGIVTSWNDGAWRILGWHKDEIVGQDVRVIFTPEDRDAGAPERERQTASARGRAEDERWHARKDGSRFWASGVLMPLRTGPAGFLKILRDRTEEKKTGTALYESEVLKGAILEAALDCIATIDPDSRIVEWNPAAEGTFGYLREVALGRDIAELIIPPELRDPHHQGMAHYLATGEGPMLGRRIELEAIRADGSRFPIELAINPIEIGGRPHFTAYLRDISERRRMEEALAASEERYRLALAAFHGATYDTDLETGYAYRTPRFYEMLGVAPEAGEPTRDWWFSRIHPDDAPRFQTALAALLEGRSERLDLEFRLRHESGSWIWVWQRGLAVHDTQGRLKRTVGAVLDVTMGKRAEEALRESEQRLRATYEHAFVGIAEVDASGRFLRVNEQFSYITGYSREELLARFFADITHSDDRETDLEQFRRQMAGEIEAYTLEKRYIHKDGDTVWIELAASRVDDMDGRPLYGIRVVRDITNRKRAEEHQRLLVNELNHRVKNTLAVVQSIAAQTLRNAPSPEQARSHLDGRLVALARVHDVLTRESWEGAGLLAIVEEGLEPYSNEREDRLHMRGPKVRLSPRMAVALAMTLQELVTNAVKYGALSNETGEIRITWTVSGTGQARRLQFRWEETGGPPVQVPSRRGFGSRLIEHILAQDLRGEVRIDFAPTGVVCMVDAPLA